MIAGNKKKKRSGNGSQFPGRLHDLMEYVEEKRIDNVIGWVLDGRGFIVHDPDRLMELLPLFFSQTKYRSFSRQLNMWHFERIEHGPSKGAFIHPYFVRGNRELSHAMSRHASLKPARRGSSIGSNSSASSLTAPDTRVEQDRKSIGKTEEPEAKTRMRNEDMKAATHQLQPQPINFGIVPSSAVSSIPSPLPIIDSQTTEPNTTDFLNSLSGPNNDRDRSTMFTMLEPDPIRTVAGSFSPLYYDPHFLRKQRAESNTSLPRIQYAYQKDAATTTSSSLNEALLTQESTHAISSDVASFPPYSHRQNQVEVNAGHEKNEARIIPSFIIPPLRRQPEQEYVASIPFQPLPMASLPSREDTLLMNGIAHNQNHHSQLFGHQQSEAHLSAATIADFDNSNLADLSGLDFTLSLFHADNNDHFGDDEAESSQR